MAERLTRSLPKDTIVGRLAGDEFALFVDGLPADSDNRGPIAHLARSILTEVSRAFQLNQHEVFLTASIGVALCPRDAENVIDLIRNADAAMYYSKQNGGNTFAFYSPEMNAAPPSRRLMLKSKLRRALERDELVISTSRKSTCGTAVSSAPKPKPCCAGGCPGTATFRPRSSFRSRRKPTSFSRSASGY